MYTLHITFKTYKPTNFKQLTLLIVKHRKRLNLFKTFKVIQKIPLTKKIRNFTVLKSPHVNKKSREHFQYKIHQRLIVVTCSKLLPLLYFNYLISFFQTSNFLINSKILSK